MLHACFRITAPALAGAAALLLMEGLSAAEPEPPMFCAMPMRASATWVGPHSPRSCWTTSTT